MNLIRVGYFLMTTLLYLFPGTSAAQVTTVYVDSTNAERTLRLTDDADFTREYEHCAAFMNSEGLYFVGEDSMRFLVPVIDTLGEISSTSHYNVDRLRIEVSWLIREGELVAHDFLAEELVNVFGLMNDMGPMVSNYYFALPVKLRDGKVVTIGRYRLN